MRRETVFVTLSVCLTIVAASAIIARGGPLDPPGGPVASSYKTLDEVEPRIPINALPFDITETGSYYFTDNLSGTDGITVSAPGVTIDLMGYTLQRVGGQGSAAIEGDDASTGLVIKNGRLVGWGTGVAVEDTGDVTLQRLRILDIETSGAVINNTATIRECVFKNSGLTAITAGDDSILEDTVITDSFGDGVVLGNRSVVRNIIVTNATFHGIVVGNLSIVEGVKATSCGEAGILTGEDARVDTCHVTDSTYGVWTGDDSTVTQTVCNANGAWAFLLADRCAIRSCTATDNAGSGAVFVQGSGFIADCLIARNNGDAIRINESASVSGCMIAGNDGAGVRNLGMGGSRIDSNTLVDNSEGIVTTSAIIILRNTVRGNVPIDPVDSPYGPIVDVQSVGGNGDLSQIPDGDHPWANFVY